MVDIWAVEKTCPYHPKVAGGGFMKNRITSGQINRVVALVGQGYLAKEISAETGIPMGSIYHCKVKGGVCTPGGAKYSFCNKKTGKMISNKSMKECADIMGVHISRAYSIMRVGGRTREGWERVESK